MPEKKSANAVTVLSWRRDSNAERPMQEDAAVKSSVCFDVYKFDVAGYDLGTR
jgi:hypothetical protein